MKYFVILGLESLILFYVAQFFGGYSIFFLWAAFGYMAVSLSYLANTPAVFAKDRFGRMSPFSIMFLFPYLLITWGTLAAQRRWSKENLYDEIVPGLYLGGRPKAHELPADAAMVVDLTAEFPPAKGVAKGPAYQTLPVLDGAVPHVEDFIKLVRMIKAYEGNVYVHCAQGHGRSAAVAAGVLVARGTASTTAEALDIIREKTARHSSEQETDCPDRQGHSRFEIKYRIQRSRRLASATIK